MRVIRGVGGAGALAEGSEEGVWHGRGLWELLRGCRDQLVFGGPLVTQVRSRAEDGMMGDVSDGA